MLLFSKFNINQWSLFQKAEDLRKLYSMVGTGRGIGKIYRDEYLHHIGEIKNLVHICVYNLNVAVWQQLNCTGSL